MKNNLLITLTNLLKQNNKFLIDGELSKAKIQELAFKLDSDLIKLLLTDKNLKELFFKDIDGVLIFENEKFVKFVNNKEFLPDSFTSFKNKIGLADNRDYLSNNDEVVLNWPYKDCILAGGQDKEDAKRDEIFYNEILGRDEIDVLLDSKAFTNFKKIDKDGEKNLENFNKDSDGNIKDNLLIKGNNLLALHSLKKKFAGKVKLIYIDPPYNTGGANNIFTYNNTFNHSTWLTFMKNRLEIAKEFLTKDGFIAIAIDHYELFYLGTLADEIFGRENRVGIFSILHNPEGRQNAKFSTFTNEYMIMYSKNIEIGKFNKVILQENIKKSEDLKKIYNKKDNKGIYKEESFIRLGGGSASLRINKPNCYYPIYVSKDLKEITLNKKKGFYEIFPITNSGQERTWKIIPNSFNEKLNKGEIFAINNGGKIEIKEKYRIDKGKPITTNWINSKYNSKTYGTKLLEEIIGRKGVSFPKSLYVVQDTIKIMTGKNDVIMDFHAGSGTTGHAVLDLNKEDGGNRKFILVEQLQEHIEVCVERNQKVCKNNGEGSFVYMEIAEKNNKIADSIEKAEKSEELKKILEKMEESGLISYKVKISSINENIDDFDGLNLKEQKEFLLELLDKNQMFLNYSEIDDAENGVSEIDKKLNKNFYN